MVKRRYFTLILSVIMAFSGVCLYEAVAPQAVITAYAASLSAPKVTASNSSLTSVKLKWGKVKGAKKYTISRSTKKNSGFKTIKTITKASTVTYTDSKLTCGKTYYYKVTAVNGKKKSASKVVKITAAPPAVTGLKAKSDKACGKVTVSYKAVKGATGYEIYSSSEKNGTYKLVTSTKKTSYTHKTTAGSKLFYKVKAYKTVGKKNIKGAYSSAASVTVMSHDFGSYIVDVPATCSQSGSKHTTCSICGAVDTREIEPTGEHSYTAYAITVAPGCTTDGIETSSCRMCNKTLTRTVKATGHSYTSAVTAPNCTDGGYTTFTCSKCNDRYTADPTNPKGHNYSGKVTKYPTCIGEGEKLYTCSDCGSTYTKVIEATGEHDYSVINIIKEPTCTEDGEIEIHCSTDGCTAVNPNCTSVARSEHQYIYEADGEGQHHKLCKDCGKIEYLDGEEFESCKTVYETYEKDGIQYAVLKCVCCDFSADMEWAYIDEECPHNDVEENLYEFPATCEFDGFTGITMCFECGMILDCGKTIPATGHSYETVIEGTTPTCTDTGKSAVVECSLCGERKGGETTVEYLPTGHAYKETVVPPSCISDGYTVQKCERCGVENMSTASDFVKSAGGHTYGNPTTDTNGYRIYTCTVCGEKQTDTTCYIDLSTGSVSVSSAAQFVTSASNNYKLLLTYNGESDYEITGNAENLIIDLDMPDTASTKTCDIKLAGVTITNDTLDIINIKNQRTDDQKPKVSISAKVDTVNTLTTRTDGNAIDSSCPLELKGRGELVLNTAASAISCGAKLSVKNLTLTINSAKRGIDLEAKVNGESVYYNMELAGNAVVTINSGDDGIRCKNFEASKLDNDEIDSIVNITSTSGDGIDAKGNSTNKKSVTLYSGKFTITAGKKLINVDSKKGGVSFDNTPVVDGSATVNGNKYV